MEKMTWKQIQEKYPKQWVSLYDLEWDESETLQKAKVFIADSQLKSVTKASKGIEFNSHMFRFTGPVRSFSGFLKVSHEESFEHAGV